MTQSLTHKNKESNSAHHLKTGGTNSKSINSLNSLQNLVNESSQVSQLKVLQKYALKNEATAQLKDMDSSKGLPTQLKAGVENLSGVSMDDVNVNYGSSEPSKMGAAAFAKGSDIHVGPGQEQHLPHEAWHVVQQKKGRVKPTAVVDNMPINDNPSLEKEADVMGAKAVSMGPVAPVQQMSLSRASAANDQPAQFFLDTIKGWFGGNKKGKEGDKAKPEAATKPAEQVKAAPAKADPKAASTTSALDTTETVVGMSSGVGKGINSALDAGLGSEGKLKTGEINSDASGIGGAALGNLQKFASLVNSGSKFFKEQNFDNGAKLFLDAADMADSVLKTLEKTKVMDRVPLLGAAVMAFRKGMQIFNKGNSLRKLKEAEKGKSIDPKDLKILEKYATTLKVDLTTNSIDFAISIARAVGDFFPPVGQALAIVNTVASDFAAAIDSWKGYKALKEKTAIARVSGGSDEMSEENEKAVNELNEKVNVKKPKGLKQGSLMNLVQTKISYNKVEKELEAEGLTDEKKKESETQKATLKAKIDADLLIYNNAIKGANKNAKDVTFDDIEDIRKIHSQIISQVLQKKEEQRSTIESMKVWIGSKALPKKDKILKELNGVLPDAKGIDDLASGANAEYFWGKTEAALKLASKGRQNYSKEELRLKAAEILKNYEVPAKDIEIITKK